MLPAPIFLGEMLQLVLERSGLAFGNRRVGCQGPQPPYRRRQVSETIHLLAVHGYSELGDLFDLRRVATAGPHHDDIGVQGNQPFHINCRDIANSRHPLCSGRLVRVLHGGYDTIADSGSEQCFSRTRGETDDAGGRLGKSESPAGVVEDGKGRGLRSRSEREHAQCDERKFQHHLIFYGAASAIPNFPAAHSMIAATRGEDSLRAAASVSQRPSLCSGRPRSGFTGKVTPAV